jgi:cysteine synthase
MRLSHEVGILCGNSCTVTAAVALRLAKDPQFKGETMIFFFARFW